MKNVPQLTTLLTRRISLTIMALSFVLVGAWTSVGAARFGINLGGLSPYATEFVYKDLVKTMGAQRKGTGFTEEQFDTNGYPKFLNAGQSIELYFGDGTGQIWPVGDYHVFYDGEGTVSEKTGSAILKQTVSPGHQIWTVIHGSADGLKFSIDATTSSNYLKNLRIILPGFENNYQADPIHPSFKQLWSGVSAFRFMDWMGTNGSTATRWNQIPSAGYLALGYNGMWGGQTFSSDRYNGSPELAVQVCNAMNADMWICMPAHASDDCIQHLAQLVKNNLNGNLKVYIEYSNECWNWIFEQTGYCRDQGVALGLTTGGALEYYVYRSGQMFKIWEDVWGTSKSRVVNVFAWQTTTSNPETWINTAINTWYKNNPKYNPAGALPEFYANAPYIWDKDQTASSVDQLFAGINDDMSVDFNIMSSQKSFADDNGLEYGCYEAGQHYSSYGQNEALDNSVFIPANRDMRMKTAYEAYLGYWKNTIGAGLMMLYSSCGTYSKYGSWGILERYNQDITTSPKYMAVKGIMNLGQSTTVRPVLPNNSKSAGFGKPSNLQASARAGIMVDIQGRSVSFAQGSQSSGPGVIITKLTGNNNSTKCILVSKKNFSR